MPEAGSIRACPWHRYDGYMSRTELDQYHEPHSQYSACYESDLLNQWQMSAGVYQTGENAGKPMHLNRIQDGSLAVMTTRKPRDSEAERFIFAVWLVDHAYVGDDENEGFVKADPIWRLELEPGQAEKMLFWNYYYNANKPDRIVFGSGLHRYLTDVEAAQVLHDIAMIRKDEFSNEFFLHFCELNGIEPDALPEPSGALIRFKSN